MKFQYVIMAFSLAFSINTMSENFDDVPEELKRCSNKAFEFSEFEYYSKEELLAAQCSCETSSLVNEMLIKAEQDINGGGIGNPKIKELKNELDNSKSNFSKLDRYIVKKYKNSQYYCENAEKMRSTNR